MWRRGGGGSTGGDGSHDLEEWVASTGGLVVVCTSQHGGTGGGGGEGVKVQWVLLQHSLHAECTIKPTVALIGLLFLTHGYVIIYTTYKKYNRLIQTLILRHTHNHT